jgi:hypothetical protein
MVRIRSDSYDRATYLAKVKAENIRSSICASKAALSKLWLLILTKLRASKRALSLPRYFSPSEIACHGSDFLKFCQQGITCHVGEFGKQN